jgi:hypothetical protein
LRTGFGLRTQVSRHRVGQLVQQAFRRFRVREEK